MPIERLGRDPGGESARLLRLGRFLVLIISAMAMVWTVPAHAKKVALIIANSTYASEGVLSLRNPVYDADLVARSAEQAGFEVTVKKNLGRVQMLSALSDFRALASTADVAMIYYAGHGLEVDGLQYLVPIDAIAPDDFVLKGVAIEVGNFVEVLRGARNGLLILDACRNSGITDNWKSRSRSVTVGFSSIPQEPDMLVMTSAGPGQQAQDGPKGESSPFARSFAKWLPEPGLDLAKLGTKVSGEVSAETQNKQVPFTSSGLRQEIVLIPRQIAADPEQELFDWDNANRLNTIEAFQDFIRKYPNSSRWDRVGSYLYQLGGVAALNPVQDILERRRAASNATPGQGSSSASQIPSGSQAMPGPITADYVSPEPTPSPGAKAAAGPSTGPAPVSAAREQDLATPRPDRSDSQQFAAVGSRPAVVQPRPSSVPPTGPESGPCLLTAAELQSELNNGRGACGIAPGTFAPAKDRKELPQFPPPPTFSDADYPNCRDDFQALAGNPAKLESITACWKRLNEYSEFKVIAFVNSLIAHQNAIATLYEETMGPDARLYFTTASQQDFFDRMKAAHHADDPGGANRVGFEATQRRLEADRKYVEEQYNFYLAAAK